METFEMRNIFLTAMVVTAMMAAPITIGTFTPNLPANAYSIATLNFGNVVNIAVTWTMATSGTVTFKIGRNGGTGSTATSTYKSSPAYYNFLVPTAGDYSLRLFYNKAKPIPYTISIAALGQTKTYEDQALCSNGFKAIHSYNITRTCVNATIETNTPSVISYFNMFYQNKFLKY